MKNLFTFLLVFLLSAYLASDVLRAQNDTVNIMFLSDDNNDDNQFDFLKRQGFNVTKFWADGGIASWGQDTIDMLNNSDLIICGRSLNSGDFDGVDKPVWHSLTAPLIINSIHAGRSSRINFFNTTRTTEDVIPQTGYALLPDDPIFDSVTLTPGENSLVWFDRKSNYIIDTSSTNGEIVVAMNDTMPLLVRFDANVPFYPGAGDSAAAERIYCGLGGEPDKQNHFPLSKEAKTVYLAEISRVLGIPPMTPVFGSTEYTIIFLAEDERDDIQIDFLKEQGFAVTKFWPGSDISTWSQDTLDILNNAELIIAGRSIEARAFDLPDRPYWNDFEAPMVFNNPWGAKYIDWFQPDVTAREAPGPVTAEINIADDPILEFAPEIAGNELDWMVYKSDIFECGSSSNGTWVLSIGDTIPLVVRFDPEVPFYPGANDSAIAPITYFAFGGRPYFSLTKNAQAAYYAEILRMLGLDIEGPSFFGTDATLSSIAVDKGTLVPAFSPDVLQYSLDLGVYDTVLQLSGTPTEETSTVLRDGSYDIVGNTTLYIGVQSQIGQEVFYSISVTKEPLDINDNVAKGDDISLYPNPFSESIRIRTEDPLARIQIIDMQGKMVFTSKMNRNEAEIDLNELAKGIYILKAETKDATTYIRRIIKN